MRYLGSGQPLRYWCQDETRLGLKTIPLSADYAIWSEAARHSGLAT
ncbi:hypothetical protein [Microcoleus sp. FACHB-831]|nr:hypothetical protein [Microcoleus sp. FACHB-831]